ncbi:MAG: GTP 3',8-cyclase MoaA [Schaedlerella sp.]|nr:GTP 3',8-cyclase MoaA [Schaedlerella sp.]
MLDQYGRNIDYLRISITDRCNLRCRYCMPDGVELKQMEEILTYEEIETICRMAAQIGIKKIKVTGGEPLVRRGCTEFIGKLKAIPGIEQVTLTTNGVLLKEHLEELVTNGLDAMNISLDSLNADTYRKITGRDELHRVLDSILEAVKTGIRIKINAVLQKDTNGTEWESLIALAKENPIDVRFIEMMPIGYGKQFEPVYNEELLSMLKKRYPEVQKDCKIHGNGPAVYYKIPGFQGSIGFISAIHGKFCDQCNRIRLTAEGRLKPCLCYGEGIDLKEALRSEKREEEITQLLKRTIEKKPKQHCFEMIEEITEKTAMIGIGG